MARFIQIGSVTCRRGLPILLAVALLLQGLIAETHIHPSAAGFGVTPWLSSLGSNPTVGGPIVDDGGAIPPIPGNDESTCLICRVLQTGTTFTVPLAAILSMFVLPVLPPVAKTAARPHGRDFQFPVSRAPPLQH